MYNPYLLVVSICIVVALILYLFYWNRVLGYLLSLIFRVANWNRGGSSIWVDIGSIHFSLLAGSILLKDVRYHSSNQTLKIVKARIAWRYWIRQPTAEGDLNHARLGGEEKEGQRALSCRVQLSVQGYEWFLYNRTEAYDNIVSQMEVPVCGQPASRVTSTEPRQASAMSSARGYSSAFGGFSFNTPRFLQRTVLWVKAQLPTLDPKDLLPLGIEVYKGAIICGNPSTPNLLVSEFQRAEGTFGIVQSKSTHDLYKQVLSLKFQNASIHLVDNSDFQDPMTRTGQLVREHINSNSSRPLDQRRLSFTAFAKLWRNLQLHKLISRRRTFRPSENVHDRPARSRSKSRKSVEEDTPIGAESATLEYAIDRKVLETPLLELLYYADVVGEVPSNHTHETSEGRDPFDIGNGDSSPEWGIELVVRSGFLRYGPWTDRQRADLQRAFFPPAFHDVQPTPHLQPGDKRIWTFMKVFIELRDDTTLQIPFRETSKNWQWDGEVEVPQRPRKRESASIHITAGDSSSVTYIIPMVASSTGYESRLEVHLDDISVTSSLNDIRLVTAESCRVSGELPAPLKWNVERQWTFAVSLRRPVIYLLRDHINMFTDLGRDWTSGPPSDCHHFIPMVYAFELDLHHYEINLYANDHNIIDKPLIRDENAMFTIRGVDFHNEARIPSTTFRPESTAIPFSFQVPKVTVDFSLPRWNTHSLRASPRGNTIIRAGVFRLEGSYRYYSEVREENTEQLKVNISARNVAYKALGWSIRHLLVLRDNYFGSFTHFSTLYEYIDKRKRRFPVGDPILLQYREGSSNVLHVEVEVDLEDGSMMLPAGLPGYEMRKLGKDPSTDDIRVGASVVLSIPTLQVQFRLHDYFMEMSLNIDSILGCIEEDTSESIFFTNFKHRKSVQTFVVDGFDITANRLFGPQPRTSTYLCIWEIHIGNIRAAASALQLKIFMAAGNAFRFGFSDSLNAPAAEFAVPVDPDVTFLKFSLDTLEATWLAGTAAVRLSLPRGLRIDNNDLAGEYHGKVTGVNIPHITMKVLLLERNFWLEVAELIADGKFDVYSSARGWKQRARAQREFVEEQDHLTGRAKYVFDALERDDLHTFYSGRMSHKNGLYLPPPWLSGTVNPPKERIHEISQTQTIEPKPKPWRWSRVSHSSDSDGETGVSEADRDARLARTRSITPTVSGLTNDYEDNMTSGDESDNEDLSEAETSDSDWSGLGADTFEHLNPPFSGQHHRWTRRYEAYSLDDPSVWHRSPFTLIRDSRPFGSQRKRRGASGQRMIPIPHPISHDTNSDIDTLTFRVRCCDGLKVTILPPVLIAVARLQEEVESSVFGPELYVDSLIAHYLSIFTGSTASGQQTTIDAHLSSVRLHVLQRFPVVEEEEAIFVPRPDDPTHVKKSINILLDVCSTGWDLRANMYRTSGTVKTTASVANDDLSLTLKTISDKDGRSNDPNASKPIFGFFSAGMRSSLMPQRFGFSSESISVEVGHDGPALMVATAAAFAQNIQELLRIQAKWADHDTAISQSIICGILKSSSAKSIIDPLSTIQPSYLVQSGRPHELRIDTHFRFLIHLRICLWHIDNLEPRTCSSHSHLSGGTEELESLIHSRLATLAIDADATNAPNLSTMEILFPVKHLDTLVQSPVAGVPSITFVASIQLQMVRVLVRDPSDSPPSELVVTKSAVIGRFHKPELIHHSALDPMFSQTSLKDKGQRAIRRVTASVSLGGVNLHILPHLMRFAQHVLRVRRHYTIHDIPGFSLVTSEPRQTHPKGAVEPLYGDFIISLQHFRIRAAAENLTCELGASTVKVASSVFLRSSSNSSDQSMNYSILFDDIFLRARSTSDLSEESYLNVLASLNFRGGKANMVMRKEPSSNMAIRAVWSLQGSHLNVPRSAIRLYRFIEEWKGDFIPGVEATLQALLSELHRASTSSNFPAPVRSIPKRPPLFQIHGHIASLGVTLQVMHGTWVSWDIHRTTLYVNSKNATSRLWQSFGVQIGSQIFTITSKSSGFTEVASSTRLKLVLPSLSLTGHYDGLHVHALASVDFFRVMVKPSHWDTLLAVQQKFGQDFNDLVALIDETSRRRNPRTAKDTPLSKGSKYRYSCHLKMGGFRIGLEGLSSIVYLECEDIRGGIYKDSSIAWDIRFSNLALSLASRISVDPQDAFSRNHRSAFVILDFRLDNGDNTTRKPSNRTLRIDITKVHAVMQPSSIGEVGDFIDHLQAEMLERKEQRALQLQGFKEKTRTIMKTFEVKIKEERLDETPSWLNQYTIGLTVGNVGAAFPLALDQDLEFPQTGSGDSSAVRAFLISIKSITFGTQRGESGQARMENFSFQFVPRFKQSNPIDFSGESHQTRNRLVYPKMTAQLRSDNSATSRQIRIAANVSGFILDLDSSIPDYIFSLIDVYRQGTERVTQLAANIPRNSPRLESEPRLETFDVERKYTAVPTSSVFASMTFLSGKVRLYSGTASKLSRTRSLSASIHEATDEQFLEFGAEIFKLPEVSVWAEYRATPASHKVATTRQPEPSILMFKSTIHSSENTLRPTLLPFLTELVTHVEVRMRKVSSRNPPPPTFAIPNVTASTTPAASDVVPDSVSSMQISFSLRIDQSKLELTCQPDVNVIAGLHWDSGGFIVNITPGARKVTFTGSVGGLTAGLKHGFLSEDCVSLNARNLAFSASFAKVGVDNISASSVSVILDTQFSGGVRFSRLQDVLCFKAVWLDRIPIFTGKYVAADKTLSKSTSTLSPASKQEFTTALLIRIREIRLDVDLGQSISAVTFDMKNALIRTRLTEALYEVSLSVAEVTLLATGNVSGHAYVPDCVFQTIRRRESSSLDALGTTKMLELSLTSGALEITIESDHQKLLQYRAQPLEIDIFDDWSMTTLQVHEEERLLRLSFTVSGTEIIAVATISTIPKLLSYVNKFRKTLDAQREGAARESDAFRITRTPKPDNPLSEVANAMIHSARNRFKEAEEGLSYMIRQHMSLRLDLLRMVVFPRSMADGEMAQFIGCDVHARLDRVVESDSLPAKRDLHLAFSSMTISKFSQLNHNLASSAQDVEGRLLLLLRDSPEANIVGLPSMNMHMRSEEIVDGPSRSLLYDFDSKFVRREGNRALEDIYITLNVSLYSWLTVLKKNLTREMDQALTASDVRTGPTSATPNPRRKPEALQIPDIPMAMSSGLTAGPHSPLLSAPSMGLSKSASSVLPSPVALSKKTAVDYLTAVNASPHSVPQSPPGSPWPLTASTMPFPANLPLSPPPSTSAPGTRSTGIVYQHRHRQIERLTMRQLGEATPDVMHPFFMKKAGFNLEDSLPQYVHEYATIPLEEIMEALLKLYSKQLLKNELEITEDE